MSIIDQFAQSDSSNANHAGHAFSTSVLKEIEAALPSSMTATAETGCGKSTILFSNISASHLVFTYDDRQLENSSVRYYESNPLTRLDRVEAVFGSTQQTLPAYRNFRSFDCVLIDGPHGYPFPDLEYYYLYPHIREGGILIIDDVHIPTVGRLADLLQEDDMFEPYRLIHTTALFRRTSAPLFDPLGDGWYEQKFNRRRIPANHKMFLQDGGARRSHASQTNGHDPSSVLPARLTYKIRRRWRRLFGR